MQKAKKLNTDLSSELIGDAIFDNFNIPKLREVFAAGAFVDNDFDLENNSTFVYLLKHLKNLEIRGEEIDQRNLANFYKILVQNGLNFPENFPEQVKFYKISENLSNLMQDLQNEAEIPSRIIKQNSLHQLEQNPKNYLHK